MVHIIDYEFTDLEKNHDFIKKLSTQLVTPNLNPKADTNTNTDITDFSDFPHLFIYGNRLTNVFCVAKNTKNLNTKTKTKSKKSKKDESNNSDTSINCKGIMEAIFDMPLFKNCDGKGGGNNFKAQGKFKSSPGSKQAVYDTLFKK